MSDIVWLHSTTTGELWAAVGHGQPYATGFRHMAAVQFVAGLEDVAVVRVAGLQRQATMIVLLFDAGLPLQLASPALVRQLATASEAILQMQQWLLSPSLGGWRIATREDRLVYAMADAGLYVLVDLHPVWRAWSFIEGISEAAAGQFMATTLDPRWFVNPAKPDRIAKVQAWWHGASRASVVRRVWAGQRPDDLQQPGAFLWQRSETRDAAAADKLCVAFLVHTWRDAVRPATTTESLFDPTMLLPPDVAAAYQAFNQ